MPHSRASGNLNELEEERRLCFVGITRAQERLILSKANVRTVRGMRTRTTTSPFLYEMPADDFETIDRTSLDTIGDRDYEREDAYRQSGELSERFRRGQLVRHPTFGLGRISEISDMGSQTRAIVEFNAAGRKTLILEHARLEAV